MFCIQSLLILIIFKGITFWCRKQQEKKEAAPKKRVGLRRRPKPSRTAQAFLDIAATEDAGSEDDGELLEEEEF